MYIWLGDSAAFVTSVVNGGHWQSAGARFLRAERRPPHTDGRSFDRDVLLKAVDILAEERSQVRPLEVRYRLLAPAKLVGVCAVCLLHRVRVGLSHVAAW
jgi:hypothetical protein